MNLDDFNRGTERDTTAPDGETDAPRRDRLKGLKPSSTWMNHDRCAGLPILYQDEFIFAVDKPAGLLTVGGGRGKGPDVQSRLRRIYPSARVCHRLDKDASGVLLAADGKEAAAAMRRLFERRRIRKFYAVLLVGSMTRPAGRINRPVRDARHRHVPFARLPVAQTRFWTVARLPGYTLLIAEPVTGLTHQLRLHFAGLGHFIAGDRLYGHRRSLSGSGLKRLGLHAACVVFRHPYTKRRVVVTAPLPDEISRFVVSCPGGPKALQALGRAMKTLASV